MEKEKRTAPGGRGRERKIRVWVKRQGVMAWIALAVSVASLIATAR